MCEIDRKDIFRAIELERERQEQIHPLPKQSNIEDENVLALKTMLLHSEFLAVLVEEVGEVAKAFQGEGDLKEELIQVASVCVRILENVK